MAAPHKADLEYPDELDLEPQQVGRHRLQKYRGLKSFRTSPWDPQESLPRDYHRIFAFENLRRAHKRAKLTQAGYAAGLATGAAPVGALADIVVGHVPADVAAHVVAHVEAYHGGTAVPLALMGLLPHETKLSVCHASLRREGKYGEAVASKQRLLFVTGVRTFTTRPVYSPDEHAADKFKMERFLHPGRQCIASFYAPIAYPPLPVLAFALPGEDPKAPVTPDRVTLVAAGTHRGAQPERVILKKLVLTGYPVKVHKKRAVVRYMFYNPDDVRWFKPLELWSKEGRRGRIKQPVGTHGSMKCYFDGPVSQSDTVCVSLYKRVFPKWPQDMRFA